MRKKVFAALLLAVVILGYHLYDDLFPVADAIRCPDAVNRITVEFGDSTKAVSADAILQHIGKSVPTRIQSVNDRPTAPVYYTIVAENDERTYYYYLYEENGKIYIEMPYEGVYEADAEFLDYITNLYAEGNPTCAVQVG